MSIQSFDQSFQHNLDFAAQSGAGATAHQDTWSAISASITGSMEKGNIGLNQRPTVKVADEDVDAVTALLAHTHEFMDAGGMFSAFEGLANGTHEIKTYLDPNLGEIQVIVPIGADLFPSHMYK